MDDNNNTFEQNLLSQLYSYLKLHGEVANMMPDCPDVEQQRTPVCNAYLPDGVREFQDYPLSSLGWMAYVGMAMAHFWDADWEKYSHIDDIYAMLRDARGYDLLDEHIAHDILALDDAKADELSTLVGNLAARTYNYMMRQGLEPGTAQAVQAYIGSLHQLYLMGMCIQLHRMGYEMKKLQ